MNQATPDVSGGEELSSGMFARFSAVVYRELGIEMPPNKRILLQGRLQRRMRQVGCPTYEAYYDYVFSAQGKQQELINLLDAVTTNKTEFFREVDHFEHLVDSALPALLAHPGTGARPLAFWSAGCSTGQEAYTLAMVLGEVAQRKRGFRFSILATDISTKVLATARMGIYAEDDVTPIPMHLRRRYLMRSRDHAKRLVRIVPALRAQVRFRRLNFMEEDYGMGTAMDVIFFRNVLIYFDRSTQEKVLVGLCRCLRPGGYLFTGHSETLAGLPLPLRQVGTSVYVRTGPAAGSEVPGARQAPV